MSDSKPILSAGDSKIFIDIGASLWDQVKEGGSIHDLILPHWIELLEAVLRMRTGQRWEVSEIYQDGISFEFNYQLSDFNCQSICWTIVRIIEAFDSVSQFLWAMTEWPIKRLAIESETESEPI